MQEVFVKVIHACGVVGAALLAIPTSAAATFTPMVPSTLTQTIGTSEHGQPAVFVDKPADPVCAPDPAAFRAMYNAYDPWDMIWQEWQCTLDWDSLVLEMQYEPHQPDISGGLSVFTVGNAWPLGGDSGHEIALAKSGSYVTLISQVSGTTEYENFPSISGDWVAWQRESSSSWGVFEIVTHDLSGGGHYAISKGMHPTVDASVSKVYYEDGGAVFSDDLTGGSQSFLIAGVWPHADKGNLAVEVPGDVIHWIYDAASGVKVFPLKSAPCTEGAQPRVGGPNGEYVIYRGINCTIGGAHPLFLTKIDVGTGVDTTYYVGEMFSAPGAWTEVPTYDIHENVIVWSMFQPGASRWVVNSVQIGYLP